VIYRSVCELVNNSIKHSGATRVDIGVELNDAVIEVSYRDNGVGFDATNLFQYDQEVGTGYFNMLSRVKSMKGKLEVTSDKDKGVFVHISIPTNNGK
ncbi:MAG: hypothetical protein LC643_04930, partial [Bacteroidales bacterium]|nr:hypothetical protein [Bacteroidales bacterium]